MSPEPSAASASAYDESSYVHMLEKAAASDRLRCNFNIHESFSDPCQRFFNAISSGTYIRPHRHLGSWADEIITCVFGSALLVVFDDFGCVTDAIRLGISDQLRSAVPVTVVKKGQWHTVLSTSEGAVLLEAKAGPFIPDCAKEFASWSPAESTAGVRPFLKEITDKAFQVLKQSEE